MLEGVEGRIDLLLAFLSNSSILSTLIAGDADFGLFCLLPFRRLFVL